MYLYIYIFTYLANIHACTFYFGYAWTDVSADKVTTSAAKSRFTESPCGIFTVINGEVFHRISTKIASFGVMGA